MQIKILEQAIDDLSAGYRFYESQQEGLGDYFLDSLFADIDSLLMYAGIHPVFFGKFYRLLASRFPFAVYYHVEGSTVLIYAVLDCRQSPGKASDRLT